MALKLRKNLLRLILISPLFLSACLSMPGKEGPETISVSQMTTAQTPSSAVPLEVPLLYCKIGRGSALFGREWYDFNDTLFSVPQGNHARVKMTRIRSTEEMSIEVFFDASGQKVIFCPFVDAAPTQRISCSSLYALPEDLRAGIKRTFDIPATVRGGVITCAHSQGNLPPLDTPAAGGN